MIGDVKIGFIDGTEKEFTDIDDYRVDENFIMLIRFGYRMFFNSSQVKYIGRKFDIDNRPRGFGAGLQFGK